MNFTYTKHIIYTTLFNNSIMSKIIFLYRYIPVNLFSLLSRLLIIARCFSYEAKPHALLVFPSQTVRWDYQYFLIKQRNKFTNNLFFAL